MLLKAITLPKTAVLSGNCNIQEWSSHF